MCQFNENSECEQKRAIQMKSETEMCIKKHFELAHQTQRQPWTVIEQWIKTDWIRLVCNNTAPLVPIHFQLTENHTKHQSVKLKQSEQSEQKNTQKNSLIMIWLQWNANLIHNYFYLEFESSNLFSRFVSFYLIHVFVSLMFEEWNMFEKTEL